jgi:hypothetical protein
MLAGLEAPVADYSGYNLGLGLHWPGITHVGL